MNVFFTVLSAGWAICGMLQLLAGNPFLDYITAVGVFYIAAEVTD